MSDTVRDNWKYFGGALLLHVLMALALLLGRLLPQNVVVPESAIKGVLIDHATLNKMLAAASPPTPKPVEPEPAPPPTESVPPEPPPAVEKPAPAEHQLQLEQQQEKKKLEQQMKLQEADRQKQLIEQKKQADAEAKRQQQEADKKRLADIQQKQRDAEQKKQAEADARAQAAREAELREQLAAEEGRAQAVNSGLLNQYVAMLNQRVERNWTKPPSARAGLTCQVKVTQATGGTVLSVQIGSCNGDDAVRQSIEAAVYRASPLPMPPDARLFDRNLTFNFKPVE